MIKKTLILIVLLTLSITNNVSFGSVYNASTLKRKIKQREIKSKIKTILFHYGELKNADLKKKRLSRIDFHRSNFEGANLQYTKIFSCDFAKTNLKNANFSNADFSFFTCITEAASVEGANFENVTGLRSYEKQFLRENGAINVPEDDSEECTKIMLGTAALCATVYGIIHLIGS